MATLLLLAAVPHGRAQTVATGTFTGVSVGGGEFEYTITLNNVGSTPIETFWNAWVPGKDFMAVSPTDIVSPSGWTDAITGGGGSDGFAIQWKTSTAPLAEDTSLNFSFESTVAPSDMAGDSVFYPSIPVETSFVYSGQPFSGTSDDFVVQPAAVPEPSTWGLIGCGTAAVFVAGSRRRRVTIAS